VSINKAEVLVGMNSCGRAAGAEAVYKALEKKIAEKGLDVLLKPTGCVGMCSEEVLVDITLPGKTRVCYGGVHSDHVPQLVEEHLVNGRVVSDLALVQEKVDGAEPYPDLAFWEESDFFTCQNRVVLKNCGNIDPESIEEYETAGGYQALKKAVSELKPDEIVQTVIDSGLRGRGGAGFPTGLKWKFCRQAQGEPKYLVCNADEGDPGAFMDRNLLEGDPHAVIEGMVIGAYAIGCAHGYIYVRAEYPLAVKRLKIAVEQAKEKGYLGKNILGTNFSFDLKLKLGAGAFVCGEETALIASIEGERGMPRPRPPFPAQSGLWGKPTNINNVETFGNVPQIILNGSQWYSAIGSEKSKGTKVFALAGKIKNTGMVEVSMGLTLRDLVEKVGGGIPNKKKFKAAQLGGPSGGCVPADLMDTPIDYESLVQAGAIMGSGGVVVMDQNTCMVDMARYFLTFTRNESCGKCVPCRVGTRRMLDILERITQGKGSEEDIDALQDWGAMIKDTSLCGLGQTAPNPVLSTIRYFRDEYDAHIQKKICPSGVCSALLRFEVDSQLCRACGLCLKACEYGAISDGVKKVPAVIDLEKCTKCRACIEACPFLAIY
jgi:NADH-quinone oxidoreductase subunit F